MYFPTIDSPVICVDNFHKLISKTTGPTAVIQPKRFRYFSELKMMEANAA